MKYQLLSTAMGMDHCCSHYLASCRCGDVTGHGRRGVSASAVGITKSHCCSTALQSNCCSTMFCRESHMSFRHPPVKMTFSLRNSLTAWPEMSYPVPCILGTSYFRFHSHLSDGLPVSAYAFGFYYSGSADGLLLFARLKW